MHRGREVLAVLHHSPSPAIRRLQADDQVVPSAFSLESIQSGQPGSQVNKGKGGMVKLEVKLNTEDKFYTLDIY